MPIGHGHRFDLVMRYVNHRDAEAGLEFGEFSAHVDAQFRIQVGERFVHEERLRMAHHCAAESDTLTLSAGKLGGATIELAFDRSCSATLRTSRPICHDAPPPRGKCFTKGRRSKRLSRAIVNGNAILSNTVICG